MIMTWADFLSLNTGYPMYTMAVGLAYVMAVIGPFWLRALGIGRVYAGWGRQVVRGAVNVARAAQTHIDMGRMDRRIRRGRTVRRITEAERATIRSFGPHPRRVACANPTMCDDCRPYL